MVYLLGMVAGLLGFGEVYPLIVGFAHSTSMGQITLPKLFDLPYGLLVFAAVLMALGAFAAGEWAEKRFGGKLPDPEGSIIGGSRRLTPVRALALSLAVIGLFAAFAGDPYRGHHATIGTRDLQMRVGKGADLIEPVQLADWIIQDRNDFRLVDLRQQKDYNAYHIPAAENFPLASLTPDFAAHNEKILLCSDDSLEAAKAWFLLDAQGFKSVYVLSGGMQGWKDFVLFPIKPQGTTDSAFERQAQVAKFFGGAPKAANTQASTAAMPALPRVAPPSVPAAPPTTNAAPPRKKKEGC